MTSKLVKQAFDEVSKLPEEEQEAVASWLLEELASERKWQEAFAESWDMLAAMADEALGEHRMGRTAPLEPDKL